MDVNSILSRMRQSGTIEKGAQGEEAVWSVLADRPNKALLYNSVRYPYQSNRQSVTYLGNIKYEDGNFIDVTSESLEDEIDEIYITPYRIFLIEVKSYHVKRIDVYDHWINRVDEPMDKSPVTQAEKHARHFYHAMHSVIPDGNPEYIKPIVCFVDRTIIRDARDEHFQRYIPICTLNKLNSTIDANDKPLGFKLNLNAIDEQIKRIAISIAKEL